MEINAELRDEINAFYENAHTEAIKTITQYKNGFLTTEEMEIRVRSFYFENFSKLCHNNGKFRLLIDESNEVAFFDDYDKWKNGGCPDSRPEKPYLLDGNTGGKTFVSDDIKALFFESIEKFGVDVEYFRAVPNHYKAPDYSTTFYNNNTVWKIKGIVDDDGLSTDENPIGKTFIMYDKYGLKTTLEIIEEADRHQREHNGLDYRGIGTIEGYTATRPREIYVEKWRKGAIWLVYYLDHGDGIEDEETFRNFPLWQEWFEFVGQMNKLLYKSADRFIDSCCKEVYVK